MQNSQDLEYPQTRNKILFITIIIQEQYIAAGLLAKNAVERGLSVKPYIKTTLSPGSNVVTKYFQESGVDKYLEKLGFTTAVYGCMTYIGNSGELDTEDLLVAAVLSGNRNFEARIHQMVRANYLASPPLVVAYALAGTVNIDFDTQPLGTVSNKLFMFHQVKHLMYSMLLQDIRRMDNRQQFQLDKIRIRIIKRLGCNRSLGELGILGQSCYGR